MEGNETIVIGVEHTVGPGNIPLHGFTVVPAIIVLGDVDDPDPVIAGAESVTLAVAENTATDTLVGTAFTATDANGDDIYWSLEGDDAEPFAISDGQLSVAGSVNYEEGATRSFNVVASDGGGAGDTVAVTINVTDDNTEAPSAPGAPAVSSAAPFAALTVSWTEPANAGPAITGYDVQYRPADQSPPADWIDAGHADASTSVTITGLTAGAAYEVQVRASNDEGTGEWSDVGTGSASSNSAPVITNAPAAGLSVAENTAGGHSLHTFTATDADGDSISWSLEGTDAARFAIGSDNGQVSLASGTVPDYETKTSYSFTVKASDGFDSDTVAVTVNVTDVDEPPAAPYPPVAAPASTTSITVAWAGPHNLGPSITGFNVRYRQGASGNWIVHSYAGTDTFLTITGLMPGTSYQAQVRAINAEGAGPWSESVTRSTYAAPGNNAPVITNAPAAALAVAENTASGHSLHTFTATDADGDSIAWSLEGADKDLFAISAGGELTTASVLNHEESASRSITVKASDSNGGEATASVTVTVTDVDTEAPGKPAAPTLTAASHTSLSVSWSAPANTGPAITGYDVQYRPAGQSPPADWIDAGHDDTSTSVTISSLSPGTTYQARVSAINDEGNSGWSDIAEGSTDAMATPVNQPPQFSQSSFKFNLRENRGRGWKTPKGSLAATDPDGADDAITYAITGGNPDCAGCGILDNPYHNNLFRVANNSGITYQGNGEDYESFPPGASAYVLTLTATDGEGASSAVIVTVDVKDAAEAPAAPAEPVVAPASDTSLTVNWTEPANAGPSITGYDVQYRLAGQSPEAAWTDAGHSGTSTSVVITGLAANTEYQAQVRASNDEGTSDWSPIGSGITAINAAPVIAGAETVTLAVMEDAVSGTNVGAAFTATDADGDAITWSLEGADAALFAISGGQLSVAGALNYEESAAHSVTVVASDDKRTRDTVAVTINVTDVAEAPSAPPALVVASASATGLTARWTEPANAGPAITDYDVQYRPADQLPQADWIDAGHAGASTDVSITDLAADTVYLVQVRARNAESVSDWSVIGVGRTSLSSAPPQNRPPEFKRDSYEFALPENHGRGWQTPKKPLTATDPDEAGGAITYAILWGNPDCAGCGISGNPYEDNLFRIAKNASITYQGSGEDYESFPLGTAKYPLAVTVSDEHGATTGLTVTILVKDISE